MILRAVLEGGVSIDMILRTVFGEEVSIDMILLENFRIFQKCPRHLVMPWRERRRHAQDDFEAARAMTRHKKTGFRCFY